MLKNLDSLGFKFKVGEIVTHRLKTSRLFKDEIRSLPLLIVERIAQECHGGVQLIYRIRMSVQMDHASFIPDKLYELMEIELEEYNGKS